jgi:phosphoadenosine phosphosulfate reductase
MDVQIEKWNKSLANASAEQVLEFAMAEFGKEICLSSSLGAEDQILTHMMLAIDPTCRIITLDTGRLFPETLNLIDEIRKRYHASLDVFFPDYKEVQAMVKDKGINLFYESVENRKLCCHIRKIEPLKRALTGMKAWITGIRKDQTINRFTTQLVEWDETHELIKFNPLFKWTEKMVWDYIRNHNIPYNKLHDKGFPSIGCQPCTRAILPGEDTRAGRWWWEDQGQKECGLHTKEN